MAWSFFVASQFSDTSIHSVLYVSFLVFLSLSLHLSLYSFPVPPCLTFSPSLYPFSPLLLSSRCQAIAFFCASSYFSFWWNLSLSILKAPTCIISNKDAGTVDMGVVSCFNVFFNSSCPDYNRNLIHLEAVQTSLLHLVRNHGTKSEVEELKPRKWQNCQPNISQDKDGV